MRTKVDIISGFLGAGKTTLIKKLLEEGLKGEKLAIIENEFGEIGIDGRVLEDAGINVREINSGCICCTLAWDFETSIREVIGKYRPDRMLIEPSGVSRLSDVVRTCESPGLKDLLQINMLMIVVDALKYSVYAANFGDFYEDQVKHAKTIILSRTQRAETKKLESVVRSIQKLNASANIITTPWEDLDAGLIISVAERDASISLARHMHDERGHEHPEGCECGCDHGHSHAPEAGEVFEEWGAETPAVFDEKELKAMLEALDNEKQYGMILRGKGIVQTGRDSWAQFDYVPGEYDVKGAAADYTGRLCVIGRNLNKTGLERLFHIIS